MSETSDAEARSAARRFHSSLEEQLKRYDAVSYVLAAAARISEALNGRVSMARWRPHDLIHSIEAMCAFRRGHRSTVADTRALARVLNVYHEHDDPYINYLLTTEQNLHLALRTMATQQFPFQYKPHYRDIGRAYSVFGKGLNRTSQLFQDQYDLSILDWFRLSLCCFALLRGRTPAVVTAEQLRTATGWGVPPIEPAAIDTFLRAASRTMSETGRQFRQDREGLDKPYLYGLIRSGFMDVPLLECTSGSYVCPVPGLLFRNAADGLIARCRGYDPVFGEEIGPAFEKYVMAVLSQLPSCNITRPDKLQYDEAQRACDFAVETDDAVLLIECKAVSETARFMLESAIRGQNATTKIQDGIVQICDTARLAHESSLGFDVAGRPLFGVVVTYGHILFANSEWYRKHILNWDASTSGPDLAMIPNIFSIPDLEQFVLVIASTDLTPRQLFESKAAQDYAKIGDWSTFLPQLVRDRQEADVHLDVAQRDMEELFRLTMGDDRYEQMMDPDDPEQ